MRRHIVPLPALLVEPQPPPAPLLEVVLPPHPQDRGTPARRSDFPPRDCRSCRGPSRRPPPREPRRRARHLPSTASAAEGCRRLRDERGPRDGGWWTHGLPPKVGNRDLPPPLSASPRSAAGGSFDAGRRAVDLREVPAIRHGGQLPETSGSRWLRRRSLAGRGSPNPYPAALANAGPPLARPWSAATTAKPPSRITHQASQAVVPAPFVIEGRVRAHVGLFDQGCREHALQAAIERSGAEIQTAVGLHPPHLDQWRSHDAHHRQARARYERPVVSGPGSSGGLSSGASTISVADIAGAVRGPCQVARLAGLEPRRTQSGGTSDDAARWRGSQLRRHPSATAPACRRRPRGRTSSSASCPAHPVETRPRPHARRLSE